MSSPLARLLRPGPRLVAGLMSGTSLDGVDAAIVRLDGTGTGVRIETLGFVSEPYDVDLGSKPVPGSGRSVVDGTLLPENFVHVDARTGLTAADADRLIALLAGPAATAADGGRAAAADSK